MTSNLQINLIADWSAYREKSIDNSIEGNAVLVNNKTGQEMNK